ncbi:MAG: hypothetical protein ACT4NV_15775 [Rhodoferax sp.]
MSAAGRAAERGAESGDVLADPDRAAAKRVFETMMEISEAM